MPAPNTRPYRALSKQPQIGQHGKTGRGKISRVLFSVSFQEKRSGQIKGADFLLIFRGRHWYIDHVSVWQVIPNNTQFVQVAEECSSLIFQPDFWRIWDSGSCGVHLVLSTLPNHFWAHWLTSTQCSWKAMSKQRRKKPELILLRKARLQSVVIQEAEERGHGTVGGFRRHRHNVMILQQAVMERSWGYDCQGS